MCIQDDGTVAVYDMLGTFSRSFHMGQEARETKIVQASSFMTASGTGLAVLTTSLRFFVVNNVKDPRIRRFPDIPGFSFTFKDKNNRRIKKHLVLTLGVNVAPSCWTAIHSPDDRATRIVAAKDKDVYLLEYGEQNVVQRAPEISHHYLSIATLTLSPCRTMAALLTDAGVIWIGSADFRRKLCEHDAQVLHLSLLLKARSLARRICFSAQDRYPPAELEVPNWPGVDPERSS